MRMRFSVLLAAVSIAAVLVASVGKAESPLRLAANGFQAITATGSAQLLTVPAGTTSALICIETANIRWRDDGVAPSTTVGMPLKSTDACMPYAGPIANWQFIAQSGSPVVSATFYK